MFNSDITSLKKLLKAFPDEQSCIDYLEQIRWAGKVVSPYNAESKVYKCAGNIYKCKNTGRKFNVRTGTMYDNTKVSLQSWFLAVWLVTSEKKGLTSVRLARHIEVTQKTAWFMLQRIRACFGIENYNEMDGIVEADESFYGGKNVNRHKNKKVKQRGGRNFIDKVPIVGVVQRDGKLTALAVPNTQQESLQPVIRKYVNPGATLITDDWKGYIGMNRYYDHRAIKDTGNKYEHKYGRDTHTNQIEGAWKIMKNSMRDMYNCVSRKHIQLYVDEFVYRYNMRKHEDSDKFNWLQFNCGVRTKYVDLINNEDNAGNTKTG